MPHIAPLPSVAKISGRFHVLIGLGILFAIGFYLPNENASQSLADWCRDSIGIFVWAPLGVLIASIIACFMWTTFCIRCPKCAGRIRWGRSLSERRTVLYPCAKCDILWGSEYEQVESPSSGG
jgi:hypothetical protein